MKGLCQTHPLRAEGMPRKRRQKECEKERGDGGPQEYKALSINIIKAYMDSQRLRQHAQDLPRSVQVGVCELHIIDCCLGSLFQSHILSCGACLKLNQKQVCHPSNIYVSLVPLSTSCYADHYCSSQHPQLCQTSDDCFHS